MSKKKESKYKVLLDIKGTKHNAENIDLDKAIESLGMTWVDLKNIGVMTVSKGSKKAEHIFNIPQMKRLFNNKTTRGVWVKNFKLMLK